MIDFLQQVLVVASLLATCYAPFHYLDRYASPEGRAKMRLAIRTGQPSLNAKPLATMLDAVFGSRHFTFRCFVASCITSLVFTILFLGIAGSYWVNLSDYFDRRTEATQNLERAMDEASPRIDGERITSLIRKTLNKNAEG